MLTNANPRRLLLKNAEPTLEQDACPTCGTVVRKGNLRAHYEKVHPKRASSFSHDKPTAAQPRRARNHPRRKLLFYGLLGTCIILISTVAALVISENTVRMHIQPQLSVLIEGAPSTVPSGIGINQTLGGTTHSIGTGWRAAHPSRPATPPGLSTSTPIPTETLPSKTFLGSGERHLTLTRWWATKFPRATPLASSSTSRHSLLSTMWCWRTIRRSRLRSSREVALT